MKHAISIFVLGCLVFLLGDCTYLRADPRYYEAEDPSWYNLMDTFSVTFYPFLQNPSSVYRRQFFSFSRPNLHVYGPDQVQSRASQVLDAYDAALDTYGDLFNMSMAIPEVHIFLVRSLDSGDHGQALYSSEGQAFIILIGEHEDENVEHTTIHELMHVFQRYSGLLPQLSAAGFIATIWEAIFEPEEHESYLDDRRWFIEGPAQFGPIIVGAPEQMINKKVLYFKDEASGRFQQALTQAHGKSLTDREELACLFWYYYYRKVHNDSLSAMTDAFFAYKNNGFSNESMDWFNFEDFWMDFALAHFNEPGEKTDVFLDLDSRFEMVMGSALDGAQYIELPYDYEIELKPYSQMYFEVDSLEMVNGAVVFSFPEKEIPEGVEMSAVMFQYQQEVWKDELLDKDALGDNWVKRFPVKGVPYLEGDTNILYDRIVFVFTNYSDEEKTIQPVISGTLYRKYEGRGVRTESDVEYRLYGNVPIGADQYLQETGTGFRMYVLPTEIYTESRNLWFERKPALKMGDEDLDLKALKYILDNGHFKGKVYFEFKAIIPEEVVYEEGQLVEKGKIKVVRTKKENFHEDVPNFFKVRIDKADLMIIASGDPKAYAALVRKIEQVVATKYKEGTFGFTLSQLFQQTIALDTRSYNSEYDVSYKRGKDLRGRYLKIKLGKSMWFILRQVLD